MCSRALPGNAPGGLPVNGGGGRRASGGRGVALTLDGLDKHYGARHAVRNLDLDVAAGEFVVIVGPSGCGKSTTLRLIAGLEAPSGGHVRIGGRSMNGVPPGKRDVAMVFQNHALYPHLSVYGNLAFGLRRRGTPAADLDRRVQETARMLQIEPLLERRPGQLSGGQRQRVAMGRALVREPGLFLLDEPLSSLDAGLRLELRRQIGELHRRLGTTTVYVTHDQAEAMALADRLVVMRGGEIAQVGTPAEVYARPRSRFVAGFIGTPPMNLLEARVVGAALVLAGTWLKPPHLAAFLAAYEGQEVGLGLRPEGLRLLPAEEVRPGAASLPGQVNALEPLGAHTDVRLRVAGQLLTVRVSGPVPVAPGQAARVLVDVAQLHAFDLRTGLNLASPSPTAAESRSDKKFFLD